MIAVVITSVLLSGAGHSSGIRCRPPLYYLGGETALIRGQVRARAESILTLECRLIAGDGVLGSASFSAAANRPVESGDWMEFSFELPVPSVKRQIHGWTVIHWSDSAVESPAIILPAGSMRDMERITRQRKIGIVDPDGTLARHLQSRHIQAESLSTRLAMRAFRGDLVMIRSSGLGGARDSLLDVFRPAVLRGLTVLVIEPEEMPRDFRNGMAVISQPSPALVDDQGGSFAKHPLTEGLGRSGPAGNWLAGWRGESVANIGFLPPIEGNFRVIAGNGSDSDPLAALLEVPEGSGRFVFSGIRTGLGETESIEPLAPLIFDNILLKYLSADTVAWRTMAVLFDTRDADRPEDEGPGMALDFFSSLGNFGDSRPSLADSHPLWLIEGRGDFLERLRAGDPNGWEERFRRIENGTETAVFFNLDAKGLGLMANQFPRSSSGGREPSSMDTTAERIRFGKGEVYLMRMDAAPARESDRRSWLRRLTDWGVEVIPTDRSAGKIDTKK